MKQELSQLNLWGRCSLRWQESNKNMNRNRKHDHSGDTQLPSRICLGSRAKRKPRRKGKRILFSWRCSRCWTIYTGRRMRKPGTRVLFSTCTTSCSLYLNPRCQNSRRTSRCCFWSTTESSRTANVYICS